MHSAENSTIRFMERFEQLKKAAAETEEETAKRLGYSRSWVQKVKKGVVVPKGKAWRALEAAERAAGIGEKAKEDASRDWYKEELAKLTQEERETMGDPQLAATWVRALEGAVDNAVKGNKEGFREMLRVVKHSETKGRPAFFRLVKEGQNRAQLAFTLRTALRELEKKE